MSRGFCAALFSLFTISTAAHATEVHHYARLCRQKTSSLHLTLTKVQSDPARYVGQVFELRGKVCAKSQSDRVLLISLALPGNGDAPPLEIPPSEREIFDGPEMPYVRVLVQVAEGGSGNVAPLKVLAIAREVEAALLDREAEAQAAAEFRQSALLRQERLHRQQTTRIVASGSRRGLLASRGGFSRGPRATDGDARTQANYYLPQLETRAKDCFVPYFNWIARYNPRLDAPTVGKITFSLLRYSARHEVDPRLVVAMIVAESEFDPHSTSHSGAMGLGQLMPETARDLGLDNPYDIEQNVYGAIRWLHNALVEFSSHANPDGSLSTEQLRLAMAAYNAGMGAVHKYHGVPPYRETQAYVRHVEQVYLQLCNNAKE